MITVTLKDSPDVRRVVQVAFPAYKKHSAFLSAFGEHGKSINSYWDGGSRSVYVVVDMTTGKQHPLPTSTHPYFDIAARGLANASDPHVTVDHVGNVTLKHLPEGFALVQGGTFCGKQATAHVFVPAGNMAKLLTAKETK